MRKPAAAIVVFARAVCLRLRARNVLLPLVGCVVSALFAAPGLLLAASPADRSVTRGTATTVLTENAYTCPIQSSRPSPVGEVVGDDGRRWTTPAKTEFANGPRAFDLYNDCTNVRPKNLAEVDLSKVPLTVIDQDGSDVVGYLMADNYFELYVNGKLVGVDAVPFTPFNSAVVRFKAKRPITYAVKLVDWEEHLSLGTESKGFHPGDGGFVAAFSDGTITDASWKAQSFYVAPLNSPTDVVERGNVHDSAKLGRVYPDAMTQVFCALECYAVRYPIPDNWAAPQFDSRNWPAANEFTLAQMGAERTPAYAAFAEGGFKNAKPIWSQNLVFDNLVLARKTAP